MAMNGQGSGIDRESNAATPDQPEQSRFVNQPHEAGRNAEGIHEPWVFGCLEAAICC